MLTDRSNIFIASGAPITQWIGAPEAPRRCRKSPPRSVVLIQNAADSVDRHTVG
jgi:hypothetical protein